jgi:hypothetical protein
MKTLNEVLYMFAIAIIYVAFFAVIGFAVYYTNSALPLFALILTPSLKMK